MHCTSPHLLELLAASACLLGAGTPIAGQIALPDGASGRAGPVRVCPLSPQSPRYLTDTCCGSVLWPGRPHQPCCGTTAYDPAIDGCCQDVVAPGFGRLPKYSCCGRSGYNPATSLCCQGRVYDSRSYGCCAGVPYRLSSFICCDCYNLTSRQGLGPRPACCGALAYDSTKQLCCDGSLRDVRGLAGAKCCGSQLTYVGSNVGCCRGVPYQSGGPFSPLCCPDGTIGFCCTVNNATFCV